MSAEHQANGGALFTCISCAVAFSEPALQRQHFASDWHRYNMKRRVATLPPVSAVAFNQKVIERREQTAVRPDPKGMTCDACKKVFSTDNAFRSHMASKKHQERESKYAASKAVAAAAPPEETHAEPKVDEDVAMKADNVEDTNDVESASVPGPSNPTAVETAPRLLVSEDADEEEIGLSIEAKIAAARNRLTTSHCLFCSHAASSIDENLSHMASAHSFFIPDQDYLVDLPGLLTYLGEKVSIGNTCLYCPNGGKEFGSLEAVRAHMRDKGHCKIAYDTDDQKLEVSDYYDFESSYPDVEERKARRAERRQRKADEKRRKEQEQREAAGAVEGDEWEEMDVDDDAEADEVVVIEGSESEEDDSDIESELSSEPGGLSLAADGLSLRLPSGRTLGHRSLRIYYNQNLRPIPVEPVENASTALTTKLRAVRKRLADPSEALIPSKGGAGGYGQGLQVMKARNAGEAKWAKNMAKQNREWRAREAHKTRIGFVHNSQKHFRDPLLQ